MTDHIRARIREILEDANPDSAADATIDALADLLDRGQAWREIELVVFPSREVAEYAGFRGRAGTKHPQNENIRSWWPSLGSRSLDGLRLARITIDPRTRLDQADRAHLQAAQAMFRDPIWMEF